MDFSRTELGCSSTLAQHTTTRQTNPHPLESHSTRPSGVRRKTRSPGAQIPRRSDHCPGYQVSCRGSCQSNCTIRYHHKRGKCSCTTFANRSCGCHREGRNVQAFHSLRLHYRMPAFRGNAAPGLEGRSPPAYLVSSFALYHCGRWILASNLVASGAEQ